MPDAPDIWADEWELEGDEESAARPMPFTASQLGGPPWDVRTLAEPEG